MKLAQPSLAVGVLALLLAASPLGVTAVAVVATFLLGLIIGQLV